MLTRRWAEAESVDIQFTPAPLVGSAMSFGGTNF